MKNNLNYQDILTNLTTTEDDESGQQSLTNAGTDMEVGIAQLLSNPDPDVQQALAAIDAADYAALGILPPGHESNTPSAATTVCGRTHHMFVVSWRRCVQKPTARWVPRSRRSRTATTTAEHTK